MADLGNITGVLKSWFVSGFFWMFIIVVLGIMVFFFYGWMSKRSKLKYNVIEIVKYGNGKTGANLLKAGFFKSRTFLWFFDYGGQTFIRTSDGRRIIEATTEDLHDIFGKKGFYVRRKDDDITVLVPICKIDFEGEEAMFEIAPADFRDTSANILSDAIKETQGTWEKLLPYVAIGLCLFLSIISIVINMQMTNNTVNKVGEMLIQGCSNAQNVGAGTSP